MLIHIHVCIQTTMYLMACVWIHRWMKGLNVTFASEKQQRVLASSIIGDNIVSEKGAFTFTVDKVQEIREVPFVYCPNLIAKVADTVHHHER